MAPITNEQLDCLEWFSVRGGSGYVDRYGRVVAGGEASNRNKFPAWLKLVAAGYITGGEDRLKVTSLGQQVVNVQ